MPARREACPIPRTRNRRDHVCGRGGRSWPRNCGLTGEAGTRGLAGESPDARGEAGVATVLGGGGDGRSQTCGGWQIHDPRQPFRSGNVIKATAQLQAGAGNSASRVHSCTSSHLVWLWLLWNRSTSLRISGLTTTLPLCRCCWTRAWSPGCLSPSPVRLGSQSPHRALHVRLLFHLAYQETA